MSKCNHLVNEGIIQVGEKVYKIIDGDDGYLSLFSATLNSEFSPVETNGNKPTNRYKYACIQYGKSHFLLLGGDSETVDDFEIWKFSVKKNQWELLQNKSLTPLKRRYGHSVAFSAQKPKTVLYIFGGIRGIEVCQTLEVVTLNGSTYTFTTIKHGSKNWPCPRYFSTMITMQSTIWVFGGIDMNGNRLSDLWEMDHSIFDSQPRWINHPSFPSARDSHISWVEKNDLYIAGGFGVKGVPLNDIWKYSKGGWQQTMIFESTNPIYSSSFGLCEVSNSLVLAKQRSPFAGLDGLVNKLRMKQRTYTDQLQQEETNLSELKSQSSTLKTQCETLEQYSKDKKRTKSIEEIISLYSDERKSKLLEQTKEVRLQLSMNTKEIVSNLPHSIKVDNCLSKPKSILLSRQLSLKVKQDEKKFNKIKSQYEMEIEIYKSQISKLEKECKFDVTKLPNIDPSNFNTFEEFSNTKLKPKERTYALTLFHGIQLREYQRLLCEIQILKEKMNKIDENSQRYSTIVNHLSRKLSRKFAKVGAMQEELENWKKLKGDADKDSVQVNNYLNALKEYTENMQQLKSKIEDNKKKNLAMQEKLQQEYMEICGGKKEVIEQLYKALQNICEQIKEMTAEEAHNTVVETMPSLNYYMSYIMSGNN
ncbi:leucine-zipper-like transcriptional regulator 1 isoform X1 [Histomonas meleagridis]|uniref:leucine-zipper-like transcriptional regulator 1 isoform X1 n=1 Tax=Histomonas meleagridis TaxID=135588 RepID=UPI00355A45A0|nr:leucine-zipper-like transcriptional regulator 1 isoform X1 [Histomonas meleagridis]KAH0796529.1 leucine-zipper-like transcriptional regulator 1 isoform X1 [Histomonas meleagridis]